MLRHWTPGKNLEPSNVARTGHEDELGCFQDVWVLDYKICHRPEPVFEFADICTVNCDGQKLTADDNRDWRVVSETVQDEFEFVQVLNFVQPEIRDERDHSVLVCQFDISEILGKFEGRLAWTSECVGVGEDW